MGLIHNLVAMERTGAQEPLPYEFEDGHRGGCLQDRPFHSGSSQGHNETRSSKGIWLADPQCPVFFQPEGKPARRRDVSASA